MIWATPESDAWSRDFDYASYLSLCAARGFVPMCEKAYGILCQAFEVQFEKDVEDERNSQT